MIEVKSLTKNYGNFRAVDTVTFTVKKGEVLGFLGPNGAGKSTTMRMLTGFIEPTSGTATLNGFSILEQPLQVAESIGYLPESAPSYSEMTVNEFLRFIGEIRKLRGESLTAALNRVQEICFLNSVWHQPIETLSKGFRQRVGFAQVIALQMDRPSTGKGLERFVTSLLGPDRGLARPDPDDLVTDDEGVDGFLPTRDLVVGDVDEEAVPVQTNGCEGSEAIASQGFIRSAYASLNFQACAFSPNVG